MVTVVFARYNQQSNAIVIVIVIMFSFQTHRQTETIVAVRVFLLVSLYR